jgi:hypothetical protein
MTEDKSTRPKPFIFVLMPFDKKFTDIYKFGIKGTADDVGAYAERLDEQIFKEEMLDRIFNQISKADVIIGDMTDRNPNVFYEVGYAHALGKIVLLLTQRAEDIPFDLTHHQHIVYGGSISILKSELISKLQWAISESQKRQETSVSELFSMYIFNFTIPKTGSVVEIPTVGGISKENNFSLPIRIRNDSKETTDAISHVYLFCAQEAEVVPCQYVPFKLTSNNFAIASPFYSVSPEPNVPQPLQSFPAIQTDAQDNLLRQFRLQTTIPALPPGAIETCDIPFMFLKKPSNQNSVYRIRLYSAASHHDFSFRMGIGYEPEEESKKVLKMLD